MLGQDKERWRLLCEQAAVEKDPERLMALVAEIIALLEAKQRRLEARGVPPEAPGK